MEKQIWTVKHYHSNPAHNKSCTFDTKKEALEELRIYSSEAYEGVSKLFKNDNVIAFRDWNKTRISWM